MITPITAGIPNHSTSRRETPFLKRIILVALLNTWKSAVRQVEGLEQPGQGHDEH